MTQVEKLMQTLNITETEALELIESDKEIDRGAKLFELPDELKAGAKKARQAERKANSTPSKRERKVNTDKLEIMETISKALTTDLVDDVGEIVNERELVFYFNKVKYKLTLSCPRK